MKKTRQNPSGQPNPSGPSLRQRDAGTGLRSVESLRIEGGEFVLDPWPTFVRSVKFGDATPNRPDNQSDEFELKQQTAQLF